MNRYGNRGPGGGGSRGARQSAPLPDLPASLAQKSPNEIMISLNPTWDAVDEEELMAAVAKVKAEQLQRSLAQSQPPSETSVSAKSPAMTNGHAAVSAQNGKPAASPAVGGNNDYGAGTKMPMTTPTSAPRESNLHSSFKTVATPQTSSNATPIVPRDNNHVAATTPVHNQNMNGLANFQARENHSTYGSATGQRSNVGGVASSTVSSTPVSAAATANAFAAPPVTASPIVSAPLLEQKTNGVPTASHNGSAACNGFATASKPAASPLASVNKEDKVKSYLNNLPNIGNVAEEKNWPVIDNPVKEYVAPRNVFNDMPVVNKTCDRQPIIHISISPSAVNVGGGIAVESAGANLTPQIVISSNNPLLGSSLANDGDLLLNGTKNELFPGLAKEDICSIAAVSQKLFEAYGEMNNLLQRLSARL